MTGRQVDTHAQVDTPRQAGATVTSAEAASARFEELAGIYPADLRNHLQHLRRHSVKTTIAEHRPATRAALGCRVLVLEFADGSQLRIEMTKKYRESYLWTGCRVL